MSAALPTPSDVTALHDALLRWYARQTPETLAARPRAPAIVARTAPLPADKPADKPAAAGSDF